MISTIKEKIFSFLNKDQKTVLFSSIFVLFLFVLLIIPRYFWEIIKNHSDAIWGLLGAGVGGWATIRVSQAERKHEIATSEKEDRQTLIRRIHAISTEIDVVWQRYMEAMGADIESARPGQRIRYIFPINQDFFPIYKNSSDSIGAIESDQARYVW